MKMHDVTSSQIVAIGHDPETGTARVRFVDRTHKGNDTIIPGALYEYDDVPRDVFDQLLAADADEKQSVGAVFNQIIKGGGFAYRRIEEE